MDLPESDLTEAENLMLAGLLRRIKGCRWDKRVWTAIHKLYPSVAIECVIVDNKKALLTHRTGDWTGWHFPGSYLNEGETIQACVERCVLAEVGLKRASIHGIIGAVNHPSSPRAHDLSLLVACTPLGQPLEQREPMRWFPVDDLRAESVIACHSDFIPLLQTYYSTGQTIMPVEDFSNSFV